jgi:4-hydroxybenzoate polyprenyltransferase
VKPRNLFADVLSLLRVRDWTKNLFVLAVPFLLSAAVDAAALRGIGLAFGLFCLIASAAYILNDVIDRKRDLMDPGHSSRPLAAGRIGPATGLIIAGICAAAALAMSWFFLKDLTIYLAAYLVLNCVYSFAAREIAGLDIACIVAGFMLRVLAGAASAGLETPPVLFLTAMFLVTGLAVSKRICEISYFKKRSPRFRRWLDPSQRRGMLAAVLTAYALCLPGYSIFLWRYAGPSGHPALYLTVPAVIFVLWRAYEAVRRNERTPSLWLALSGDRPTLYGGLAWVVLFAASGFLKT